MDHDQEHFLYFAMNPDSLQIGFWSSLLSFDGNQGVLKSRSSLNYDYVAAAVASWLGLGGWVAAWTGQGQPKQLKLI
jgi:hypothetical protein